VGERVKFGDGERTPIYTYSKARIMDLLEVTPDDERSMTKLISDGEKYRRKVKSRRAAGMVERGDYEAAAERKATARMLVNSGLTWAKVAAKMDLPSR
jgi:hypothetical protein